MFSSYLCENLHDIPCVNEPAIQRSDLRVTTKFDSRNSKLDRNNPWTSWRQSRTNVSLPDSTLSEILQRDFTTAPEMSRPQSPTMTQTEITLNSLCEKLIKVNDKLKNVEARLDNRPIPPASRITERIYPQLPEELLTEAQEIDKIDKYEKCLPMIPEFDGTNAEQFINMILRVQTILTQNQHQYLLLGILAQKLKGKAALAVRADTISSIPKLIEKVKFLYGKTIDVSALSVKRDLCKQRPNEATDDFIERFSKIHDDIITAINTNTYAFGGTTMSEVRENFAREESIRAFKRNIRKDISMFLHCKQIDTIQEAFEFARMYDLETRYSNMFRGDNQYNKERHHGQGKQEWKKKESRSNVQCDFCKRYGHKEEECRTKQWKQKNTDFQRGQPTTNPPGTSSTLARIAAKEKQSGQWFD